VFDFNRTRNSRHELIQRGSGVGAAVGFGLLVLMGPLAAKTVYVDGKVGSSGKGTSWSTAYKFLGDALDKTGPGDQIFVAKGTYFPDDGATALFGSREESFELRGQRVFGGFAGTESSLSQRNVAANPTILSGAIWTGNNADDFRSLHVVKVFRDSTLDGLIVENGHANGGHSWNYPNVTEYDRGGGCYVKAGAVLTLGNCVFRNNKALADGGAIYLEAGAGKVVARDCGFQQNGIFLGYNITTGNSRGGAIKGDVEATGCVFEENSVETSNFFEGTESSAFGGAIAGRVRATDCVFKNNRIFANAAPEAKPTADGGAVYGDFTGTGCVFIGNEAGAQAMIGVCSGGAISGEVVNASNCAFQSNHSGPGIPKEEEVVQGGGGAVRTGKGVSSLANCVFVENTSEFRGGAVQGGFERDTDQLNVSNCTFLDNGTTSDEGSALSCNGIVRILNNLFRFTAAELGGYKRDKLIHVGFAGALRNADENYPTPASAAPNLIPGGEAAITLGVISDLYLVSPALLFVDADPLFANVADPDGADEVWGTADDGLRLKTGSAAIGKARDPRISTYVDLRPKDLADADGDGIVNERLPVDMAGVSRVQGGFADIGAYEFGNVVLFPEIAVLASGVNLTDGSARSFGKVTKGKKKSLDFTIRNLGTNDLVGISATVEGDKEISLRKLDDKPIAPGGSAVVSVEFKPRSFGTFKARLQIITNDANESPFDIMLSGKSESSKSARKPSALAFAVSHD
jgi:predicted outer membrane repeat protein